MPKHLVLLLSFLLTLGACASQPVNDPNSVSELQQVSNQITRLNTELSENFLQSCTQNIAKLEQKFEKEIEPKVVTKLVERCSSKNKPVNKNNNQKVNDKLVLGATEKVGLVKEKVTFAARIDTGADYSSIGVYNPKTFERDGENWVRFSLEDSEDAANIEYPIFDTVRIKESSTLTVDRIEIKMDIKVGGEKYKNQIFNLADRSYLEYQLLIGRSFLRDIAIVDVSRKNIQKAD